MELKKIALAGTTESSDVQITVGPNGDDGIEVYIDSVVKAQFGAAIEKSVKDVLEKYGITDALVQVIDKGAFDWVIRSRMETAICRSAGVGFNWKEAR